MAARSALHILVPAVLALLCCWPVAAGPLVTPPHRSFLPPAGLPGRTALDISGQLQPSGEDFSSLGAGEALPSGDPAAASACDTAQVYLQSHDLRFHITGPQTPDPLTVDGRVVGRRSAYRLRMELPGGADDFDLPRISGPHLPRPPQDIPVAWQLRYCRGGQWTGWLDPVVEGGPRCGDRVLWWVLEGGPGVCDFQLRCALAPQTFQPPGSYRRCFRLSAEPGDGCGGCG